MDKAAINRYCNRESLFSFTIELYEDLGWGDGWYIVDRRNYIVGYLICHGRDLAGGSSSKYKLLHKHTKIIIFIDIIFTRMFVFFLYYITKIHKNWAKERIIFYTLQNFSSINSKESTIKLLRSKNWRNIFFDDHSK